MNLREAAARLTPTRSPDLTRLASSSGPDLSILARNRSFVALQPESSNDLVHEQIDKGLANPARKPAEDGRLSKERVLEQTRERRGPAVMQDSSLRKRHRRAPHAADNVLVNSTGNADFLEASAMQAIRQVEQLSQQQRQDLIQDFINSVAAEAPEDRAEYPVNNTNANDATLHHQDRFQYMHYTISEDRSASEDSIISQRLAVLGARSRSPKFEGDEAEQPKRRHKRGPSKDLVPSLGVDIAYKICVKQVKQLCRMLD